MGKKRPVFREDHLEDKGDLSQIHKVLIDTKEALKQKSSVELSHLSNATLHSAAVNQDALNIIVAVLVYALSKVFSRNYYTQLEGWDTFQTSLNASLDEMILACRKNDSKSVLLNAGKIRDSLNLIEGNLGVYIKDVFRKAEVNKAFKLYEHGLSSEQTAKLLGISLWELSSYIGQSTITEAHVSVTMPEKERIKIAEDFLL
jgi:hypothetical protein